MASLKERAVQETLPTRVGKELRPITFARPHFDVAAAMALLRAKGATDDEVDSLYRTVRVEQVRELNTKNTKRRGKASKGGGKAA